LQRSLNQRFRIRPRDERVGRDHKFQPVKFAATKNVGDRFAAQTALKQHFKLIELLIGKHLFAMRDKPCAINTKRLAQQ
jgi:hypothetical protein